MQTLRPHAKPLEDYKTFIALTLDDFFLRNEWGRGLSTISTRRLPAVLDKKVLDLCEKYDVSATLFVPSAAATRFPDEVAEAVRRKFEVAGHGLNHEDFRKIPEANQIQIINDATRTLEKICKVEIFGWRSPGLFINEDVKSAISKSNIRWCSNIRLPVIAKQLPFRYYDNSKMEIPITSFLNDYNLYEKIGFSHTKVLNRWLKDFNRVSCRQSCEVFTILLHPWVEVKEPKRLKALETFLEVVKAKENVDFKTCTEIYRYFQIHPTSHFWDCFSKVEAELMELLISYSARLGI